MTDPTVTDPSVPSKSFGELSYEQFADRYAATIPTKPHNAYLADPAIKALLPNLTGLRVFDAGCGPGYKSRDMLDAGAASLTAVDVTPRFVEMTQELLRNSADRATVLRHDLSQPLTFAADGSFDLIHSNLVLDYIEDWDALMREFSRVLAPGGLLVFCAGNPVGDWMLMNDKNVKMSEEANYFQTQSFAFAWGGFGEPRPVVWGYRRSLESTFNPLIDAGFRLERVVETKPTPEFHQADPVRGKVYDRQPSFICIRARK